MKTVNGKVKKEDAPKSSGLFGNSSNRLNIPGHIAEEAASKGLDCRWISHSKYIREGNTHHNGWVPFKFDSRDPNAVILGGNVDGILRRGDNVLAVRPNHVTQEHKAHLSKERARMSNFKKQQKAQLRQMAREGNIEGSVFEDEND